MLKESCSSFRLLICFWKGRYIETGVLVSRGHVSEFERCSRVSQKIRSSLGLCLEIVGLVRTEALKALKLAVWEALFAVAGCDES